MPIQIVVESSARLAEYARIPSRFLVTEIFDEPALRALSAGLEASPTRVPTPYWKDYDSYPDNSPVDWGLRFDLSRWQLLATYQNGERLGSAALVIGDSSIDLLDGRSDLALLWDVRVAVEARRSGVGRALVEFAAAAATRARCVALRVETQNVNVPACRFYVACGFALEAVRHRAYLELPDEVQLLWSRDLTEIATELASED